MQACRRRFFPTAPNITISRFKGRDVSVIGGGSSALDVVASLRASGAHARLVARRPALKWNMPVKPHPWRRLYPSPASAAAWRNRFFEHAPMVFRHLPQEIRMHIVRSLARTGRRMACAQARRARAGVCSASRCAAREYRDGRAQLACLEPRAARKRLATDHVIAATGYRVDLRALASSTPNCKPICEMADHTPMLSPNFESSVPDLYFVGLAAANTFGPVMRFLLGARYTSRRISAAFRQPVAG